MLAVQGAQGDFARALCSRLSPNLLSPEQVEAMLVACAPSRDGNGTRRGQQAETEQLLLMMAQVSPQLFVGAGQQVNGKSAADHEPCISQEQQQAAKLLHDLGCTCAKGSDALLHCWVMWSLDALSKVMGYCTAACWPSHA